MSNKPFIYQAPFPMGKDNTEYYLLTSDYVSVADFDGDMGLIRDKLKPKTRGKVAVIGSGPAGLTIAGDLARQGFNVEIFEMEPEPGGVLMFGIPEYRLPKDVVRREIKKIEELGTDFGDGAYIIYVNSSRQEDTELGRLMHDFHCINAKDMHSKILAARVQELKETCKDHHLKVILETGALKTASNIKKASILSMYAGADFIKTSTGKLQPGATLEAAYVMCQAIKEYHKLTGNKIGFKPAGGISSISDAINYYTIVKEVLGEEWLNNGLFRLGTSRLANQLLSDITGKDAKFF